MSTGEVWNLEEKPIVYNDGNTPSDRIMSARDTLRIWVTNWYRADTRNTDTHIDASEVNRRKSLVQSELDKLVGAANDVGADNVRRVMAAKDLADRTPKLLKAPKGTRIVVLSDGVPQFFNKKGVRL